MEINQESYNITYFLHKVKHELCFVNNLVQLNDTVYSVSLPVIDTYTKLNATDGRALLQRVIFQQFNSGAAKQIGFLRGMVTLCSEPDNFETHLMLSCTPDQMSQPNESEWIAALEKGLEINNPGLPVSAKSSNAHLNAWGIINYIYDLKIEFYPHHQYKNGFTAEVFIKYIQPACTDKQEINFEDEFIFLVNSSKTKNLLPFLIKSESNPVFFLTGANVLEHELVENEDGIGKELYVKCEIVP